MSSTGLTRRMTAAQIIVLAGDDLVNSGFDEFSEWQLTVASWKRDRERFGLRGFQDQHPDHKRVMMEIMGQKPHNPIHMKLMEKIRPNYYRMTPAGRKEAERLLSLQDSPREAKPAPARTKVVAPPAPAVVSGTPAKRPSSPDTLYDEVFDHVFHPVFAKWKDDPEEPSDWNDAASFLGGRKNATIEENTEHFDEVERMVRLALEYCENNDLAFLSHGSKGVRRINVSDMHKLVDFLKVIVNRFEDQFQKAGKKKAIKA